MTIQIYYALHSENQFSWRGEPGYVFFGGEEGNMHTTGNNSIFELSSKIAYFQRH
jgi:hypothetical protein